MTGVRLAKLHYFASRNNERFLRIPSQVKQITLNINKRPTSNGLINN